MGAAPEVTKLRARDAIALVYDMCSVTHWMQMFANCDRFGHDTAFVILLFTCPFTCKFLFNYIVNKIYIVTFIRNILYNK